MSEDLKIFISATSADLRSYRKLADEGLRKLGYNPIEQSNFPPAASSVKAMLRKTLKDCHAVVHIVGRVYGAEPSQRDAEEPRRSYTQMEYEIARELKKKVYVFICGDGFNYDPHEAESPELFELQDAHRRRLLGSDHVFYTVETREDLSNRVRELRDQLEQLTKALKRSRLVMGIGVLVGLVMLCFLSFGIWTLAERTDQQSGRIGENMSRISTIETELEKQRRYIKSVADAYTRQQAEIAQLKLTNAEKFDRALDRVAQSEGIPEQELRSAINLFVANVENDPSADFLDQSLAEFAQQKFAAAAGLAGQAVEKAREERLAAETLAQAAEAKVNSAREREREALSLQGKALSSNGDLKPALQVFGAALEITSRDSYPEEWAAIQFEIGNAASRLARRSEGNLIKDYRTKGIEAYSAALQVYTKQAFADHWRKININLALVLSDQAMASRSGERAELFQESIRLLRETSELTAREEQPLEWADLRSSLAVLMLNMSNYEAREPAARRLEESAAVSQSALEVYTIKEQPKEWAAAMTNRATALWKLAEHGDGGRRIELLDQAVAAYTRALKVFSIIDDRSREWAIVNNNLGSTLRMRAKEATGNEKEKFLSEALDSHQGALEVYTRDSFPQDWAAVQNNIGAALLSQAEIKNGEAQVRLFNDAAGFFQSALQVYKKGSLPFEWALVQSNLATIYSNLMSNKDLPAEEARDYAGKSAAARARALEVYTFEIVGELWLEMAMNAAAHFIFSGDFESSEKWTRRTLEVKPDLLMSHANLAHVYLLQGRYDEALAIYRKYRGAEEDIGNGKTFREAVEGDLEAFKRFPHLKHPDFERLRAALKID